MNKTCQPVERSRWRLFAILLCCLLLCGSATGSHAQGGVVLNLALLDGADLTPDNVFGYTIQSNMSGNTDALIKGKLTYRSTGLSFSYTYHYTVRPGLNTIDKGSVHPQWSYSSQALKELFVEYKKLPAGTYEYCVEVSPLSPGGEVIAGRGDQDCLYGKVNEVFLINLVEPENNAKLHESYPVLSWMVNYPFASALTYRLRVAEVKEGQNNTAAVNRNNAVYQESNIMQTTLAYPVYAKQLEKFVPYAWTVDAYYKGLLLGGAEPWRFTIIDDSVMKSLPTTSYYVDMRQEKGGAVYHAVGEVKLKYIMDEKPSETLLLSITDSKGNLVKIKEKELKVVLGENRFIINLKDQASLKHLGIYNLRLKNGSGEDFYMSFKYVNPDFL